MKKKILTSGILSIALSISAATYAEENNGVTEKQPEHPYVEEGRELLNSVHEDVRIEVVEYQKKKAMLYNELSDEAKKLVKRLERLKYKARRDKMGKKQQNGEAEYSKGMENSKEAIQSEQQEEPKFDLYVEDNQSGQ